MAGAVISCPANAYCNIICKKEGGCDSTEIIGTNGTILYVKAFGDGFVLSHAIIRCPVDLISNGHLNQCIIEIDDVSGTSTGFEQQNMNAMEIYAIESFTDLTMTCLDTRGDSCFRDEVDSRPIIHCTEDYSESCTFYTVDDTFGNMNQWECVDTANICNDYILPTSSPTTVAPTTIKPTISPTKYNPWDEPPVTLYIKKNGCDVGLCQDEYSDYDAFCSSNMFYDKFNEKYNHCCSQYTPINKPFQTVEISQCLDAKYDVVTIKDDGTYLNSMITYEYDGESPYESITKAVCFEISPGYMCYNPIITVEYETIDYNNYPSLDEYLNVAYQNKTNFMNNEPCRGGIEAGCGIFKDCAIDNQPKDSPWTYEQGIKIFYLTNGANVEPLCTHPFRSMYANVSVTCSTLTDYPSTCKNMDYVWLCLNGIDGYQNSTICNNVYSGIYDGNGEIIMSDAEIFDFHHKIDVHSQQITISGNGFDTILNHTTLINPSIKCSWIQCYITMKSMKYVTNNIQFHLQVTNGGNMKFENVLFDFMDQEYVHFDFSNDAASYYWSQIQFINCTFININNGIFNISHLANVTFNQCEFTGNKLRFIIDSG
eukprot:40565_1